MHERKAIQKHPKPVQSTEDLLLRLKFLTAKTETAIRSARRHLETRHEPV